MVASPMPSDRLQKAVTVATSIARHAGGRVQAEADGGAGEGREAERVPEGVGDEGGEDDAGVRDHAAQVAQRQHFVRLTAASS